MKIRVIIFIFLMFGMSMGLPGCAHRDPWSKTDTALFVTVAASQAADYVHTKNFLDDGDYIMDAWAWKYGTPYPSDGRLAAVKLAELGIAYIVADQLPSKWRKVFLTVASALLLYHVIYW